MKAYDVQVTVNGQMGILLNVAFPSDQALVSYIQGIPGVTLGTYTPVTLTTTSQVLQGETLMVFNITVQNPDGTQAQLSNVAFSDVATMREWVQQLPATLISYTIVSGGSPAATSAAATTAATATLPAPSSDLLGNTVPLEDPSGHPVQTNSMFQLGSWLAAGYTPLRANGTPGQVQQFLGGWLIDGNPLNVWLGLGWLPGQQDALAAAVTAGTVPASTTDLTKTLTLTSTGVSSNLLLWGGVALVALKVLGGGRRS